MQNIERGEAMANEFLSIFEYIEQERGINRESVIKAVEAAILSASQKSIHPASRLKVKINPASGKVQAWAELEVVESDPNSDQILLKQAVTRFPNVSVGDVIDWEVTPGNFGRIAAQAAKQAIIMQLRKAEKETARAEFNDRVNHIINGTVRRFDAGNIIIDFQRAEGILPAKEKIPGEQYVSGDRINALLLKIDVASSGPSLIVSRTHPDFIKRLFEREVSEIHDGVVEIVSVAREAGSRTKIAVRSNDPRVDPVGACVGVRGARVRNITNELNGERIDIVPWDANICKFAANALSPAEVISVELNENAHELQVTVANEQSKLAFGKKAQNVRLSAKLVGWTINIRQAESAKQETMAEKISRAVSSLAAVTGLDEKTCRVLVKNGYVTVDGLKEAGLEQILEIDGIDADAVRKAFAALVAAE